ncbi:MAG: hypothetical protein ABFS03_06950 [Chloroflexota bacterium]
MSSSTAAEEITRKISSLQRELSDLQKEVRLTSLRDSLEDLETNTKNLDRKIADQRARGYVFNKGLEAQAKDLAQQWRTLRPGVMRQIEAQTTSLEAGLRPIENQITRLGGRAKNPTAASPLVDRTEAAISTLEGKVSAAESSIEGMYDQFSNQVNKIKAGMAKVDWMLTEISEATFQLLATEAGVMAVKAVWVKGEKERKDDPEGVLFLTDQRLIFEQKEKIATKKILFVATEKKMVQQQLWESPAALVESVKTENQGFLNKDDYLEINFASGAPLSSAKVHIWDDSETWGALIKRAKSKDFDQDRAVPIAAEQVEKVKSAPEKCPSCGATIDQVVLRGMDRLTCDYCGHVMRL